MGGLQHQAEALQQTCIAALVTSALVLPTLYLAAAGMDPHATGGMAALATSTGLPLAAAALVVFSGAGAAGHWVQRANGRTQANARARPTVVVAALATGALIVACLAAASTAIGHSGGASVSATGALLVLAAEAIALAALGTLVLVATVGLGRARV